MASKSIEPSAPISEATHASAEEWRETLRKIVSLIPEKDSPGRDPTNTNCVQFAKLSHDLEALVRQTFSSTGNSSQPPESPQKNIENLDHASGLTNASAKLVNVFEAAEDSTKSIGSPNPQRHVQFLESELMSCCTFLRELFAPKSDDYIGFGDLLDDEYWYDPAGTEAPSDSKAIYVKELLNSWKGLARPKGEKVCKMEAKVFIQHLGKWVSFVNKSVVPSIDGIENGIIENVVAVAEFLGGDKHKIQELLGLLPASTGQRSVKPEVHEQSEPSYIQLSPANQAVVNIDTVPEEASTPQHFNGSVQGIQYQTRERPRNNTRKASDWSPIEDIVFIGCQEDPNLDLEEARRLNTPEGISFFKFYKRTILQTFPLLHTLCNDKAHKRLQDPNDIIIYDPTVSTSVKQSYPCSGIYVVGFMQSEWATDKPHYEHVTSMPRRITKAFQNLGFWAIGAASRTPTLEQNQDMLDVAIFLGMRDVTFETFIHPRNSGSRNDGNDTSGMNKRKRHNNDGRGGYLGKRGRMGAPGNFSRTA